EQAKIVRPVGEKSLVGVSGFLVAAEGEQSVAAAAVDVRSASDCLFEPVHQFQRVLEIASGLGFHCPSEKQARSARQGIARRLAVSPHFENSESRTSPAEGHVEPVFGGKGLRNALGRRL